MSGQSPRAASKDHEVVIDGISGSLLETAWSSTSSSDREDTASNSRVDATVLAKRNAQLATALQHAQTRARKSEATLKEFEQLLSSGVTAALQHLSDARQQQLEADKPPSGSPVGAGPATSSQSATQAEQRFTAVAEFATPLILLSQGYTGPAQRASWGGRSPSGHSIALLRRGRSTGHVLQGASPRHALLGVSHGLQHSIHSGSHPMLTSLPQLTTPAPIKPSPRPPPPPVAEVPSQVAERRAQSLPATPHATRVDSSTASKALERDPLSLALSQLQWNSPSEPDEKQTTGAGQSGRAQDPAMVMSSYFSQLRQSLRVASPIPPPAPNASSVVGSSTAASASASSEQQPPTLRSTTGVNSSPHMGADSEEVTVPVVSPFTSDSDDAGSHPPPTPASLHSTSSTWRAQRRPYRNGPQDRTLGSTSFAGWQRVLSYKHLLEGCMLLEAALARATERIRQLEQQLHAANKLLALQADSPWRLHSLSSSPSPVSPRQRSNSDKDSGACKAKCQQLWEEDEEQDAADDKGNQGDDSSGGRWLSLLFSLLNVAFGASLVFSDWWKRFLIWVFRRRRQRSQSVNLIDMVV